MNRHVSSIVNLWSVFVVIIHPCCLLINVFVQKYEGENHDLCKNVLKTFDVEENAKYVASVFAINKINFLFCFKSTDNSSL